MSSAVPAELSKDWGKGWHKIKEVQAALAKTRPALIHRRGPHDVLISRVIPLALSAVGAAVSLRGMYHMVLGTGKVE